MEKNCHKHRITFNLLNLFAVMLFICSCEKEINIDYNSFKGVTYEQSKYVLPQKGGTAEFSFNATAKWSAELVNDRADGWITITPTSGKRGVQTISISAASNETYDERNATVVVKCGEDVKTIVVAQKQKDALTVTSSKFEVPAEGGEIDIEVQANFDFSIDIKAEWIKQTKTKGLSTNNLGFSVDPNDTGEKREGEIIVSGNGITETIKVYQAFLEYVVITKNLFTLPEKGGIVDVEIKSSVDYGVQMLSGAEWVSEIETRAISTHTRHYAVAPNESYDSREAKLVFYSTKDKSLSDTVTISQMYKGALIVAQNEYEYDSKGGTLNLKLQANIEFEVSTNRDWIKYIPPTKGLTEYDLCFSIEKWITEDEYQTLRQGEIIIKERNGNKKQTILISQNYVDYVGIAADREALIDLYNSTNGDNWKDNTNWCSDKPLSEWYGVETDRRGRVSGLRLVYNNLEGRLPQNIGNLKYLRTLVMNTNQLSGAIPESLYSIDGLSNINLSQNEIEGKLSQKIGNLKNLFILNLSDNKLLGKIPESLFSIEFLINLYLDRNNFNGEIPKSIGQLKYLSILSLSHNNISGEIPEQLFLLEKLQSLSLNNNSLTGSIPQNIGNADQIYFLALSDNKLSGTIPESIGSLGQLVTLSLDNNSFKGELPDISALTNLRDIDISHNNFHGELPNNLDNLQALTVFIANHNNFTGNIPVTFSKLPELFCLDLGYNRLTGIIPKEIDEMIKKWEYRFLDEWIYRQQDGYGLTDYYTSSDYSQDGEVVMLQQHSIGKGIKVVLMGDAYVDRDMGKDGKYETVMRVAMEEFFKEEPYLSLRELFDVYCVKVVSKSEQIGENSAFNSAISGDGISTNRNKCGEYISRSLQFDSLDDITVILIANRTVRARSNCAFYSNGYSVSLCIDGGGFDNRNFGGIIRHECGHGFGRLADEYVEYEGYIPDNLMNTVKKYHKEGTYVNVDITSDPTKVIWSRFIYDPRYADENIGLYKGAYYFPIGVYRPTENSIMRSTTGGFNAPSREAIYKRAMKLAYGDAWEYDYEEFVKFDLAAKAKVQTKAPSISAQSTKESEDFILGAPPVIYDYPAEVKK